MTGGRESSQSLPGRSASLSSRGEVRVFGNVHTTVDERHAGRASVACHETLVCPPCRRLLRARPASRLLRRRTPPQRRSRRGGQPPGRRARTAERLAADRRAGGGGPALRAGDRARLVEPALALVARDLDQSLDARAGSPRRGQRRDHDARGDVLAGRLPDGRLHRGQLAAAHARLRRLLEHGRLRRVRRPPGQQRRQDPRRRARLDSQRTTGARSSSSSTPTRSTATSSASRITTPTRVASCPPTRGRSGTGGSAI